MLGTMIHDQKGIEGPPKSISGLGLLDIETTMSEQKVLQEVTAITKKDKLMVNGYEIHIGKSVGRDLKNSWLQVNNQDVSAATKNGQIQGCYIHGIFSNDEFRASYIKKLGAKFSNVNFEAKIDETLDLLSKHVEKYINLDELIKLSK